MFGMPRDISEEHNFELDPVYVSKSFERNNKRHKCRLCRFSFEGDMSVAEFKGNVEMLFGSNEEKAVVQAVQDVFPQASHTSAPTMEENCSHTTHMESICIM